MNAALALIVSLLAQETHDLKWDLKEGQAFACGWAMNTRITSPDNPALLMDFKLEVRGRLKVTKVDGDGARCELTLTKYAIKGKTGFEETDLLFEDGAVRRPAPDSPGGKNLERECAKTAALRLTPRGSYSVEGRHIVAGLFGGQSDFFGSQLPARPVAVGETWEGFMESPQSRQAGRAPMKVRYKLDGVKGDEARVVLDERQEIRAAGKVMAFHAVMESTFNVKAGRCLRSLATIHVNDMTDPKRAAPETPDIEVTTEFEMAEK